MMDWILFVVLMFILIILIMVHDKLVDVVNLLNRLGVEVTGEIMNFKEPRDWEDGARETEEALTKTLEDLV